jgi:hypothetical protein
MSAIGLKIEKMSRSVNLLAARVGVVLFDAAFAFRIDRDDSSKIHIKFADISLQSHLAVIMCVGLTAEYQEL